jgi:hypothetical protein
MGSLSRPSPSYSGHPTTRSHCAKARPAFVPRHRAQRLTSEPTAMRLMANGPTMIKLHATTPKSRRKQRQRSSHRSGGRFSGGPQHRSRQAALGWTKASGHATSIRSTEKKLVGDEAKERTLTSGRRMSLV